MCSLLNISGQIYILVVRTMFEDLKRNGSLLRTADSASILVALLRKQNFKTGDHVDYYDDICKDASLSSAGGAQ